VKQEPSLPVSQKTLLEKYVSAVLSAPASLCLTAVTQPAEFLERHVLDALKLIELMPRELQKKPIRVLDVGSGNGVPGIPAAIALPEWKVSLLDSDNKKCGFLDMFCKFNAIKNVHVMAARAEVAGHLDEYREQFDVVFARALGKLAVALELTIPFLKRGGLLVIPHGGSHLQELARAQKVPKILGAAYKKSVPYKLNPTVTFTALMFEKFQNTPERYPRKTGIPRKRPLE
jgi:16S rRNA (guanine527-N7)-methyltransferase